MDIFGADIPFAGHCGIEALGFSDGRTRLRARARPEHVNNLGIAHGGLICTLLDVAMGTAARCTGSMRPSRLSPVGFAPQDEGLGRSARLGSLSVTGLNRPLALATSSPSALRTSASQNTIERPARTTLPSAVSSPRPGERKLACMSRVMTGSPTVQRAAVPMAMSRSVQISPP